LTINVYDSRKNCDSIPASNIGSNGAPSSLRVRVKLSYSFSIRKKTHTLLNNRPWNDERTLLLNPYRGKESLNKKNAFIYLFVLIKQIGRVGFKNTFISFLYGLFVPFIKTIKTNLTFSAKFIFKNNSMSIRL